MGRARFSPILENERYELERHLRRRPRAEDVAETLSVFFARLLDAVNAADPSGPADVPAVPTQRLRHKERLEQLQQSLRAGFVGALRAILPPAAGPAPPPRPDTPGGPGRGDEGLFRGRMPWSRHEPPAPAAVAPPAPARVDISLLLSALEGALASADRVLESAEPLPAERVPIPWAEDSDWMELCQDLLQARLADDGPLALRHIERLRRWLPSRHGLEVIEAYDGKDEHFRVIPASDPAITEPRTLRPALVRNDRPGAVLRGEVVLPAGDLTATTTASPNAAGEETSHE